MGTNPLLGVVEIPSPPSETPMADESVDRTLLPLVVTILLAVSPESVRPAKVGLEPVPMLCGVLNVTEPAPLVTVT